MSILKVGTINGVFAVLFVTLVFVLAHNTIFTYVASFVANAGLSGSIDMILLVFGVSALAGVWGVGATVDRWPRKLMLMSIALFAVSILCLAITNSYVLIYVSVAAWGIAFGGAPTLLQTALAKSAGNAIDVAQSMMVTIWNIAIGGGGLLGGILLDQMGVLSLPYVVAVLLFVAFLTTFNARRYGFPDARRSRIGKTK